MHEPIIDRTTWEKIQKKRGTCSSTHYIRADFLEQVMLAEIKVLQEGIDRTRSKAVTADIFMPAVRKYTRAKKLTQRMLDELVQYIEVHPAEKIDGTWVQRLTIHYNCIRAIIIPKELTLPCRTLS